VYLFTPQLSLGTYFAYPRRDGSGSVDLSAWFCAEVVYPSKDGHHPGTNRAWRSNYLDRDQRVTVNAFYFLSIVFLQILKCRWIYRRKIKITATLSEVVYVRKSKQRRNSSETRWCNNQSIQPSTNHTASNATHDVINGSLNRFIQSIACLLFDCWIVLSGRRLSTHERKSPAERRCL